MNDLISVIINVYNGEKFISKCLDCVVNQTYKNLEILIINDGSTDNTLKICQSYKDKRIKIISQENMGLSKARNVGIENASGEYFYFIDADDFIELDVIEYLYNLCKKNNAMMSTCNSIDVYNYNPKVKNRKEKIEVLSNIEMLKNILLHDRANTIWNKIIKKEVFNGIRFEDRIINDVIVTYKLVLAANKVVYSNQIKYYYLRHPNSITLNDKQKTSRLIDLYDALIERYYYINNLYPYLHENRIRIMQSIPFLYLSEKEELNKYLNKKEALKFFKKIFTFRILICPIKFSEKVKVLLFAINTKLCKKFYKRYKEHKNKGKDSMSAFKRIIPKRMQIFITEHRYMFCQLKKNYKKHIKDSLKDNSGKSLSIDNEKKWINKLNKLTFADPKYIDVVDAFTTNEIEIMQTCEINPTDIIVICVEKNDIIKLKKFISHYRQLGIDKFIILDNASTDGTIEWLKQQNDVILLQTKTPYTTSRRVGWINRIIAHFGDNRWYIVADSDELLVYENCENKDIKDIIKYYEKNNVNRARAIMLDMYAKPRYYLDGDSENYIEECVFFDTNTYSKHEWNNYIAIYGGPRERMFNIQFRLTKYPLFYFRKQDVFCNSHHMYPFKENFNSQCNLVLKHYKFVPGEIKKYKEIANNSNYYNGSSEYKKYVEVLGKNNNLNFMCENTAKYENSGSLNKVSLYKGIE